MSQIKINGKVYDTVIDSGNVLRFKPNNLINKIHIHFEIQMSEMVKLTELGAISLMDLLDYYTSIGSTVSSFEELSFFEEYNFEIIS